MDKIKFIDLKKFMTPIIIERYEDNILDEDGDELSNNEIKKLINKTKHHEDLCQLIEELLGYEDPSGFILDQIIK